MRPQAVTQRRVPRRSTTRVVRRFLSFPRLSQSSRSSRVARLGQAGSPAAAVACLPFYAFSKVTSCTFSSGGKARHWAALTVAETEAEAVLSEFMLLAAAVRQTCERTGMRSTSVSSSPAAVADRVDLRAPAARVVVRSEEQAATLITTAPKAVKAAAEARRVKAAWVVWAEATGDTSERAVTQVRLVLAERAVAAASDLDAMAVVAVVQAAAISEAAEEEAALLPVVRVAAAAVDRPMSNRLRSHPACGKVGRMQRVTG